jgi:hypothetical protein
MQIEKLLYCVLTILVFTAILNVQVDSTFVKGIFQYRISNMQLTQLADTFVGSISFT